MDRRKVCLLTHVLRGTNIGSGLVDEIEKMMSSVDLPPYDVFRRSLHYYERAGLRIECVGDYVFNVYENGSDQPVITIFYNNDYRFTIDTCTLDPGRLSSVLNMISNITAKVMAIDMVDREIRAFQRLLDSNVDTPYYDSLVDLIIGLASESRWVW